MSKNLIEVDAQAFDDLMYWLDRCAAKGHLENCADLVDPWAIFDASGWRVVEATQPAAGEPEQQTAINADDLPTKKYPLAAFDFDSPATAPVAAGEPVAFSTEHGALFWHGSPQDWKGKTVQLYLAPPAVAPVAEFISHPKGKQLIFLVNGEVDLPVGTKLYKAAPPAAAHRDEAVRKDAQAAYIEMTCQPVLIDGAHHYYLSSERMQAFDRLFSVDVSDAAMRAQGDGEPS